jgi:predicted nucleic acid-binding protein
MTVRPPTYLDSSAIVKLVVAEPESPALRSHLQGRRPLVSSAIARTEVSRACLMVGQFTLDRAAAALSRIELVRISDDVLSLASRIRPVSLGPLDAIHLATLVLVMEGAPGSFVTYDDRMARAARDLDVDVLSPSPRERGLSAW